MGRATFIKEELTKEVFHAGEGLSQENSSVRENHLYPVVKWQATGPSTDSRTLPGRLSGEVGVVVCII